MMEKLLEKLRGYLRTSSWLIPALLGASWLFIFAPHKVGVLVWMFTKIFGCAFAGYWVDRIAYPYFRLHELPEFEEKKIRIIARAMIIGACIILGGLQA